MILTYKECIEIYGDDYHLKKQIKEGKLFQKGKGLYSDKENCSELEIICAKYPRAIFTGLSAYYYYNLTDEIPNKYYLATKREDTRINDKRVIQYFVNENIFLIENTQIEYKDILINIYTRERLLVDLIRNKNRYGLDFYKEVINNYRNIIDELDFFKMDEYANKFKNYKSIMNAIQLEVM